MPLFRRFLIYDYAKRPFCSDRAKSSTHCFACHSPFPAPPTSVASNTPGKVKAAQNLMPTAGGVKPVSLKLNVNKPPDPSIPKTHIPGTSISQRYACPDCDTHFCIDCDIFTHELLHNCPGCQSHSPSARFARKGKKKDTSSIDVDEKGSQTRIGAPAKDDDILKEISPSDGVVPMEVDWVQHLLI